jgi:hypothetical protein
LAAISQGSTLHVAQHFVDFVPALNRHRVTPRLTDPIVIIREFQRESFTLKRTIADDAVLIQNYRNIRRGSDQERRGIGIYPGKPACR